MDQFRHQSILLKTDFQLISPTIRLSAPPAPKNTALKAGKVPPSPMRKKTLLLVY
jgi:hypothetical protein